jgi:hypothetical protein
MSLPLTFGNDAGILKSRGQLIVNSLTDGQVYNTLSNFSVFITTGNGIRNAKHLEITNISFINYVAQFHTLKNKLAFIYNGNPVSITIDQNKYYTPTTLITDINALFVAGGYSITVAQDPATLKLVFTETGGNTVQILGQFADGNPIVNRCNAKLGYVNAGIPFASSAQSAEFPLRVNAECIYLGTTLSNDSVSPSSPTITNVLVKIPLYGNAGDQVIFIPSSDLMFNNFQRQIDQVTFNFYDEDLLSPSDLMRSPAYIEIHFSD